MDFVCRNFAFQSLTYIESLRLRENVLRKPLNLPAHGNFLYQEDISFHIGCFFQEKVIGTMVLTPIDSKIIKMRQVAIEFAFQNKGAGSALVSFAEVFSKRAGYLRIVAHSRDSALSFYRGLGYTVREGSFIEVTIPHHFISKTL